MITASRQNGLIHVTCSIFSFHGIKRSHWYYDLERGMRSHTGALDSPCDTPMTDADRERVERYLANQAARNEKALEVMASEPECVLTARQHQSIRLAVTDSMERDRVYSKYPRAQCAIEWRKRYDALEAELIADAKAGNRRLAHPMPAHKRKPYASDWQLIDERKGLQRSESLKLYYQGGECYDETAALHHGIIGPGAQLKQVVGRAARISQEPPGPGM